MKFELFKKDIEQIIIEYFEQKGYFPKVVEHKYGWIVVEAEQDVIEDDDTCECGAFNRLRKIGNSAKSNLR
jgi:hypothetical protein